MSHVMEASRGLPWQQRLPPAPTCRAPGVGSAAMSTPALPGLGEHVWVRAGGNTSCSALVFTFCTSGIVILVIGESSKLRVDFMY